MRAVFTQTRRGLRRESVGARARFGQRVRGYQLARHDAGNVLLLRLFGAVVENRQKADAALRAHRRRERGRAAEVLAKYRARDLIEAEPAVLLGHGRADEANLRALSDELAREIPVLLFEVVNARAHLSVHELPRGVGYHSMLISEVLGREDLLGRALLNEEAPAHYNLFILGNGRHQFAPFSRKSER